jgi:hypothetical protein
VFKAIWFAGDYQFLWNVNADAATSTSPASVKAHAEF